MHILGNRGNDDAIRPYYVTANWLVIGAPRFLELTGSRARQPAALVSPPGLSAGGLPQFAVPRVPAFPQIPVFYGSDFAVRSLSGACIGSPHLFDQEKSAERLISCLVLTNGARRLSGLNKVHGKLDARSRERPKHHVRQSWPYIY